MNINQEFKEEFESFIKTVEKENMLDSYSIGRDLILKYKAKGISKDSIAKILLELQEQELDSYQEEIIIDMYNRIEGYSAPDNQIIW